MTLHLPHLAKEPVIPASCYVDLSVRMNGDVVAGEACSFWFHVAIRGDVNAIRIGARTNVQDHCTMHTSYLTNPLHVGDDVTIGHGVIAHGCTIGNRVLVGMQSVIMDGAVIGDDVIIGAGSLVTEGKIIPPGVLVFGRPAQVKRELSAGERKLLVDRAMHYVETASAYREQGIFTGWRQNPYRERLGNGGNQ